MDIDSPYFLIFSPKKTRIHRHFLATSVRQNFDSVEERILFQKKYFDDYLNSWPDLGLGIFHNDTSAGYILGCADTFNALKNSLLVETLYPAEFLPYLEKFPAHLHIDLAPTHQGQGLGTWAINNWLDLMKSKSVPAAHVITMVEHPSFEFYRRHFFHELHRLPRGEKHLSLLGRSLIDT